jgi:hypothetical protein
MSVIETTGVKLRDDADAETADHQAEPPSPSPNAKLRRLPVAPAQRILSVEFRSPEGRHWHAIGGGTTVAAAIDWARQCCPDGTTWDAVSWEDLYGE